jgi:type IV pilus assembly protein PilV
MHPTFENMRLREQSGFSLLEVLVALLVISISLLGVAGMQAISIGNTGESGFRSIAATQAASIASAMSTNEQYWQNGSAAPGLIAVSGSSVSIAGSTQTVLNCKYYGSSATPCAPKDLAAYDLSQWGQQLKAALPGGTGSITCTFWVTSLTICKVEVDWLEKNQAQNGAATGGSAYHLDMMVQP